MCFTHGTLTFHYRPKRFLLSDSELRLKYNKPDALDGKEKGAKKKAHRQQILCPSMFCLPVSPIHQLVSETFFWINVVLNHQHQVHNIWKSREGYNKTMNSI
ncbi:hypothetical protein O6H91_05G039400 [Diphasiastrum complanatum]|uniref:Uncharacterized protein n=1 Tax=Diphasiastrum complanatum TaxID=34168 RepID=A0ACC2DMI2_DIPCM|nr:hypothetical protein O6H91_05G039400 [Diphasiastrum complanatum]